MKPFNIKEAKLGKHICTRGGRPARIVCYNAKGEYPIVALITYETTIGEREEFPCLYKSNGCRCEEGPDAVLNLMMASEKKSGWINIYEDTPNRRYSEDIYETEEEALASIDPLGMSTYRSTTQIEWEE